MAEWIDELACRALDGDGEAWRSLYNVLANRLWGMFRHYGASDAECEELVQATWLKILENADQYDRDRPFEPYLFTIARRLWIDHCRRNNRLPTTYWLPEDEADAKPLPLDMIVATERAEQVHHCLDILTDDERAILVLRFWHKLTNGKIAQRLDSSEASIRGKSFRAIRKLADCMQL